MRVGCDKILDSPLEEDRCGVCAGDGSGCRAELFTARAVAAQSTSTSRLHLQWTKKFKIMFHYILSQVFYHLSAARGGS